MDYDFPETVGNQIFPTYELHHFAEGLKPPTRYINVNNNHMYITMTMYIYL